MKHYPSLILALLLLSACGGPGNPSPNPDTQIERIEITPGALLLTQAGENATLTAQAYDGQGNPIEASFSWSSTDDSVISINANGQLSSLTALGSAQITANAEGVSSAPTVVLIAEPVAEAVLISDEQVLSEPVFDNEGFAAVGDRYTVKLSNAASLSVGDTVLGSGEELIAGRVVEIAGNDVGLELLSLDELFTTILIDETFEVDSRNLILPNSTNGELELLEDGSILMHVATQDVVVSQEDDTFTFTIGLLTCEADAQIALSGNQVEAKLTHNAQHRTFLDHKEGQTERLIISFSAAFQVDVTAGLILTGGFEGKVVCRQDPVIYVIPVGGPLAYFAGGQVPFGVGVDLEGKFELSKLEAQSQATFSESMTLGFDYDASKTPSLTNLSDLSVDGKLDSKLTSPLTTDNARLSGGLTFYAYSGLDLGSKVIQTLGLDLSQKVLSATGGLKQDANLATPFAQTQDKGYASSYDLSIALKVGAGDDLAKLLSYFEVSGVNLADFSIEGKSLLNQSPVGILSADQTQIEVGENVTLTVELDPAFISYLGQYNVQSIDFYLKEKDGNSLELLHSLAASENEHTFNWTWDAKTPKNLSGQYQIYAFIISEWLPLIALEINSQESDSSVALSIGEASCDIIDPILQAEVLRQLSFQGIDSDYSCADLLRIKELSLVEISNLEGLQHISNLNRLNITRSDFPIPGEEHIASLSQLTEINMFDNTTATIDFVRGLEQLERLSITQSGGNDAKEGNINALAPVATLSALRTLEISNQKITSMDDVSALMTLEVINLSGNTIASLPALTLPNLRTLSLANNALQTVPQFTLPALEELILSRNEITDISGLNNLPSIRSIYLEHNLLSDLETPPFTALVENQGLGEGDRVDIEYNCLQLSDNSFFDINTLIDRGVEVFWDFGQNGEKCF